MVSPDLIKEALRHCSEVAECSQCVYRGQDCIECMCADALEYIEQLESRNIKPLVSSIKVRLARLIDEKLDQVRKECRQMIGFEEVSE